MMRKKKRIDRKAEADADAYYAVTHSSPARAHPCRVRRCVPARETRAVNEYCAMSDASDE